MGKNKVAKVKPVVPYTMAERDKYVNDFFVQLSMVTEEEVPLDCYKKMKEFVSTGKEYIDKVQIDVLKKLDINLVNDKNKKLYIKWVNNTVFIDDEDVRRQIE
jgi:hypothetical protein